jgi:hypothetical protein
MMLTITGNRIVLHNDGVPFADATRALGRQMGRQYLAGPSLPRSGDHCPNGHVSRSLLASSRVVSPSSRSRGLPAGSMPDRTKRRGCSSADWLLRVTHHDH